MRLLAVLVGVAGARAAPACMSFADDGCEECTAQKDGRAGPWHDMPCIYFDRDDMKNGAGKDTARCLPNGFWTAATKAKNVGAKCFGEYGDECQKSCSGAPPPDRHWGAPLLLGLAAGTAVYLAVGIGLGRRAGKRPGLAAHVHYTQWIEGVSLVRDGLSLATGRGRGSHGHAATARAATRASTCLEGKAQQASKSRKNQKSRNPQRAREVIEQSHTRTLDERLLSESDSTPTEERRAGTQGSGAAAASIKGGGGLAAKHMTPAGDGGRWVHVPS